jgi:phosphoglycerate dehydrogenase-like enzyme
VLTVTVPDAGLRAQLSDLAGRVEFVEWDLSFDLPRDVAGRVEMVCIHHYATQRDRWPRLSQLPALRYVQLPSAGFDHAVRYLPPGVELLNGRGVHSTGTAELGVALILASQRGLAQAVAAQQEGRWSSPVLPSLADRRVLVVGAGSLADALVARLRPFEVELTLVARTARDGVHGIAELPDLLPSADIVVLTVPLDASTTGLIGATELALMPDGALLVNIARGKVVDTAALLAELASGRLRAALDVTDPEPLPADHPLWHAPNTLITAHQGGNSDATSTRWAGLVRSQLEHVLAGEEPGNVVAVG